MRKFGIILFLLGIATAVSAMVGVFGKTFPPSAWLVIDLIAGATSAAIGFIMLATEDTHKEVK